MRPNHGNEEMKYWLYLAVSTVYLLNFTMGVWELPDNLPFVGNLDEFAASGLWIYSAQTIRKRREEKKAGNAAAKVGNDENQSATRITDDT